MTPRLWTTAAGLAGAIVLLAACAAAAADGAEPPSALGELGLRLDEARRLGTDEQAQALEEILGALDAADDKLSSERKTAALLLSAEARFALGRPAQAREDYAKAEKAKGPFADDAAFGAIRAREAAGDDVNAAKEWDRWLERNPRSPLRAEALLARAWNAVRRDSLVMAAATLDRIRAEAPWMQADPRLQIVRASVAYLAGNPEDALAALGDSTSGATAEYLRGLALRAKGETLASAAKFQNVAQRWPDSPLRDPALLAKADVFLASRAWRSAAEEFGRVAEAAHRQDVRAEAELRRAAAITLGGDAQAGVDALNQVIATYAGTPVAARAQYLLGEALFAQERYADAIVAYNGVLEDYFDHELAARAQYRVGRSLDALGRPAEATGAYQAVVAGYSQAPESPAAAYLAGVGLLDAGRAMAAAPYFRIVLDRYARESKGALVFASPEHFELVEAALCLLELAYHRAGDLGQVAGVPHLMLAKMPSSDSPWRAWSLLIDADALASLGRHDESKAALEKLMLEYPEHEVAVPANRLLAWIHMRTGRDDLAIATEERMLSRYAALGDEESLSSAVLHRAHIRFNEKKYREAAAAYDDFVRRFPASPHTPYALYQAGLCHLRLDRAGDAVDRWEAVVAREPSSEIGAKAWARAGDVYFRAEKYVDAKRCFAGLLEHVAEGESAARATLRIAQCEYNAGHDAEALRGFSDVMERFAETSSAKEAAHGIELALYRLGRQKDGGAVLAELVERFPTSSFAADAQFQIGMRAYEAKDWPAATEAFRRVVTQFPAFSAADRAHYLMGESCEKAGNVREASDTYAQFVSFFPASELLPAVQFRLGSLRFADGDYMQAAIDFTQVLEKKVSEETARAARYNLALCQIQLGSTEVARATLERFRAQQVPGDARAADVAYRLGELHVRAGRAKEEIAEYDAALASKPAAALAGELHYRVGSCRESLSDPDGAIRAYRAAVAAAPKGHAYHLSSLARLASLYEGRERFKDAVAVYRELIRDSNDAELVAAAKERVNQLQAVQRR